MIKYIFKIIVMITSILSVNWAYASPCSTTGQSCPSGYHCGCPQGFSDYAQCKGGYQCVPD